MSEELEECRNCKHEVKSKVGRCEYCGILNPTIKTKDIFKTIFAVLLVMAVYTYFIK